ncbi:MAG: MATE family efflux transporter [Eubacterium sp.]|nr:MATE family efflux transporter [Eubacterium sp.]
MLFPEASKVNHVEKGPIGKTLLRFAIPVLLSQLLQELYNIADCMVLGHFAGEYALAASGISGMLLSVLINFFIGFSSGVSVITSRLFGAYKYDRLKQTMTAVFRLAISAGLFMTLFGYVLSGWVLSLLHSPAEVKPYALLYLHICVLGLTAQLIYNVGTAILRSLGNTRTPLIFFLASVLINLGLDALLVIGLKTGIAGAAAATLFSQWVLAILILGYLMNLDSSVSLSLKGKGLPAGELLLILKDGIPAGLQAVFMSISSMLIQIHINSFGPDAMAGMTVYAKLEGCMYLPSFAYGIALTGFVGQNLGAGQYERIRKSVRLSLATMIATILPLSLVLMAASPVLLRLFTSDPGILHNAHEAVVYTFPVYVIYAINQIWLGAIKGLGNTSYPMVCTLLCYSLFRVIWCRILIPHFPSMRIVYLSYDVSFFLMLALLVPVYMRSRKTETFSDDSELFSPLKRRESH